MNYRFFIVFGLMCLVLFNLSCSERKTNDAQDALIHMKQNLIVPDPEAHSTNILAEINAIQIDDQGNIYILDRKNTQVSVFNTDGLFIRSFGKRGQGPGEFQVPIGMFVEGQYLHIYDFMIRKISTFSLDGKHIKDMSLNDIGEFFRPEAKTENIIFGNILEWESNEVSCLKLIKFDMITSQKSIIAMIKNEVDFSKEDPIKNTYILRLRKDKTAIWIYQKDYGLNILSHEGNTNTLVTKEYDPVKISDEDKENLIKRIYGGQDKIPPGTTLVWPEHFSPIHSLIIGDKDWIFIRTNEKNSAGEFKYDVFDENGGFRGTFFLNASILQIKNNMAYAISEDIEGFPIIIRYEIEIR